MVGWCARDKGGPPFKNREAALPHNTAGPCESTQGQAPNSLQVQTAGLSATLGCLHEAIASLRIPEQWKNASIAMQLAPTCVVRDALISMQMALRVGTLEVSFDVCCDLELHEATAFSDGFPEQRESRVGSPMESIIERQSAS